MRQTVELEHLLIFEEHNWFPCVMLMIHEIMTKMSPTFPMLNKLGVINEDRENSTTDYGFGLLTFIHFTNTKMNRWDRGV